jgi:S1-C subfamily serine protease
MDSQGNQVGPVSQTKLLELVAAGEVLPTTYVWTAGLTEWKPLKEVLPGLGNLIGKQARQPLGANFKPLAWGLAAVIGLVTVMAGTYFFLVRHSVGDKAEKFFYKDEAGNRIGPVTELELRKLRDGGDLADDSPVTPANVESWRPLAEVVKYDENFDAATLFERTFRGVPMLFSLGPKGISHGSGFVISTQKRSGIRCFIVTNRHVVEGAQKVLGEPMPNLPFQPKWEVLFFERADGRTVGRTPQDDLKVYAIHPKADVAIIECTRRKWLKDRQVHAFRLAPRDLELKPGTEVVVIGHPGNPGAGGAPEPMTFTKGQIAGPERVIEDCRFHQLQVPLTRGNSGGPVLDMTGQVVGIVTLGVIKDNQGQFNYALHVKYVYELLDNIP